jgi:hypothetical protein
MCQYVGVLFLLSGPLFLAAVFAALRRSWYWSIAFVLLALVSLAVWVMSYSGCAP